GGGHALLDGGADAGRERRDRAHHGRLAASGLRQPLRRRDELLGGDPPVRRRQDRPARLGLGILGSAFPGRAERRLVPPRATGGWSPAGAGAAIDEARTKRLTVPGAGTGSGPVNGEPAGIDAAIACGTACLAHYPRGASVTLTATAAAGSTFVGWSGGGCSGI